MNLWACCRVLEPPSSRSQKNLLERLTETPRKCIQQVLPSLQEGHLSHSFTKMLKANEREIERLRETKDLVAGFLYALNRANGDRRSSIADEEQQEDRGLAAHVDPPAGGSRGLIALIALMALFFFGKTLTFPFNDPKR
jgi:hypothetical protein